MWSHEILTETWCHPTNFKHYRYSFINYISVILLFLNAAGSFDFYIVNTGRYEKDKLSFQNNCLPIVLDHLFYSSISTSYMSLFITNCNAFMKHHSCNPLQTCCEWVIISIHHIYISLHLRLWEFSKTYTAFEMMDFSQIMEKVQIRWN